jgi:hypothetical protein
MTDAKMNPVAHSSLPQNEASSEIRIVGINTDKTRKIGGSEAIYHVYFSLSENPPGAWRSAFGEEWKTLGTTRPELRHAAGIDGEFLFVECSLGEVAEVLFPALKQAVATTNTSYRNHVRQEERDRTRKESAWKDERKLVEEMARPLDFE